MCPTSQVGVTELLHPVGFDSNVAYECDDLVVWLVTRRASNPLTQGEKEGKITDISGTEEAVCPTSQVGVTELYTLSGLTRVSRTNAMILLCGL